MRIQLTNGQIVTITRLSGGMVDLHLQDSNGESIASVQAPETTSVVELLESM